MSATSNRAMTRSGVASSEIVRSASSLDAFDPVNLEGLILDADYLGSLQRRFPGAKRFCGYGAATPDLSAPTAEWRGQDTFIQRDGIVDDFGTFDDPYAFHARRGSNLGGLKRWLFAHVVRHWMNDNVARVRAGRW